MLYLKISPWIINKKFKSSIISRSLCLSNLLNCNSNTANIQWFRSLQWRVIKLLIKQLSHNVFEWHMYSGRTLQEDWVSGRNDKRIEIKWLFKIQSAVGWNIECHVTKSEPQNRLYTSIPISDRKIQRNLTIQNCTKYVAKCEFQCYLILWLNAMHRHSCSYAETQLFFLESYHCRILFEDKMCGIPLSQIFPQTEKSSHNFFIAYMLFI